ncbi:hypothetical protein OGAPHI_004035 [Ogataea philodendri]|uniref:Small ribosomal subunit protein RACK1 n=1 Tax=Ogataea philodendri TaxID=1378263 RepID=A0A9P8P6I8_9ASCO|nr:uncharacterized protein OGAPHI_004035 [Ogataea philodendri]KAH3665847.1 hypothetical protein OGAPHI_004035 [Ogataea philodendri]
MADEVVEVLVLRGTLHGHNGWVTSLATSPSNPDLLLSASRDKTLITWQLTRDENNYGVAKKALKGHSHIVQDCDISADGEYAISASWDKTLRLWRLNDGACLGRFVGHTADVLSVSIAANSRQIVSASRDKSVKLWNTQGQCMATLESHTDWVNAVRFSPSTDESKTSTVISAGSDKLVKAWDLRDYSLAADFVGHTGYVSTITISPDGSLCASGGKDGTIILWEMSSKKKTLYTLQAGDEINALAFSPNRYWLCVATSSSIKIYNLQERSLKDELKPEVAAGKTPECVSLAWSHDGQNLFSGYTDNVIRVWQYAEARFNSSVLILIGSKPETLMNRMLDWSKLIASSSLLVNMANVAYRSRARTRSSMYRGQAMSPGMFSLMNRRFDSHESIFKTSNMSMSPSTFNAGTLSTICCSVKTILSHSSCIASRVSPGLASVASRVLTIKSRWITWSFHSSGTSLLTSFANR